MLLAPDGRLAPPRPSPLSRLGPMQRQPAIERFGGAGVALLPQLPPQLLAVLAAGRQALAEIRLIGSEHARTPGTGSPFGKSVCPHEGVHRPPRHPQFPGNRLDAHPLRTERHHRLIALQALGPSLVLLLLGRGPCAAIRLWVPHRGLLLRSLVLLQGRSVPERDPLQRLTQVPEQVKAIGHLLRLRCSLPGAVGIGSRAISADHLDSWMLCEPVPQGFCRPIR